MATFLNISLDSSFDQKLVLKHVQFSCLWLIGILQFIFRIDTILVDKYGAEANWLIHFLPTFFIIILLLFAYFQKWYWTLAFLFYPFLFFFWFLPKSILKTGKVYMFGNYVEALYHNLAHLKRTIIHAVLLIVSLILFLSIDTEWTKWLAVICATYFYLRYLKRFLTKCFRTPSLFGNSIEEKLSELLKKSIPEESFIVKSYINQKEDEKLEEGIKREKHLTRIVMANYTLNILNEKLSSFKTRKAFILMWLFKAGLFVFNSLLFFWFINIQLFGIDPSNFVYKGDFPAFDFFYYTLKTITYGDIALVQPNSTASRIVESASFLTIGLFFLVIIFSIVSSLHQEKVSENIKLTSAYFDKENEHLAIYIQNQFGMDIQAAMKDVKNIDTSFKNLKKLLDKFF